MMPQHLLALTTLLPLAPACGSNPAVEGYIQARLDFFTLTCACDPDAGLRPDWERSACEQEAQEAVYPTSCMRRVANEHVDENAEWFRCLRDERERDLECLEVTACEPDPSIGCPVESTIDDRCASRGLHPTAAFREDLDECWLE